MKIIIAERNRGKINTVIKQEEGRARERTIDYDDLVRAVKHIETFLGIAKTDMLDIEARVDVHAQIYPNAYKYIPQSTQVYIKRTKSGWALTNVFRDRTGGTRKGYSLTLTDTAKKAIIERATRFE